MALGLTLLLKEMVTRNISFPKGDRYVGLTALLSSCPVVLKSDSLKLLDPSGPIQTGSEIAAVYLLGLKCFPVTLADFVRTGIFTTFDMQRTTLHRRRETCVFFQKSI